ncbi:MAG: hypothetical protein JST54_33955 [Deltaproteobacteria bacterium]|nr:hypothetical protein [Deltaproteobacteria bacterium]
MTTYIDSEHLKELLEREGGSVVPASVCRGFEEFAGRLPWLAGRLDWRRLAPYSTLRLSRMDAGSVDAWLAETGLASVQFLVAFYRGDESGVCLSTKAALRNIDVLFWKAPGPRFMFGMVERERGLEPSYDRFIEYDGADLLTSKVCRA